MFEKPVCEQLCDTERRPARSGMVHRGHIRVDVVSTQVGCGAETASLQRVDAGKL